MKVKKKLELLESKELPVKQVITDFLSLMDIGLIDINSIYNDLILNYKMELEDQIPELKYKQSKLFK